MSHPNLNTFAPISPSPTKARQTLPSFDQSSHIAVVGAGAFGSWTALYLLRKGFKVTLIDAWGPAHARSSSADETRVIRSTYGANENYFDLNVKALSLWKENEERFGKKLFYNTGVLWFCYEEKTPLVDDSIPFAKKHHMEYEYLTTVQLKQRFPFVNTVDLHHAYLDPFGGYLKARESVQSVSEAFIKAGGHYLQAEAMPGKKEGSRLLQVKLSGGNSIQADGYVFACGSWLSRIFKDVLPDLIRCTKQEVYYFGVPAKNASAFENMPVWVDVDGKDFYYGIPGNQYRGFKLGVDIRGPVFDPTLGDHVYSPETLIKGRKFIAHRFPALTDGPLVESRVCPYENSPDGNFIFDLLPETSNVFILGGGSGHGFKHSPALGQLVADVLAGDDRANSAFLLK